MTKGRNRLVDRTSLPTAQRLLADENSQLQAEIKGFEEFFDRLHKISPQPYRADGGTLKNSFQIRPPPSHTPQKTVQTAYRETVLGVDHWKDAYGEETPLESMAREFGVDVAAGLTGGSATWSPLLWKQLRNASEAAVKTRQRRELWLQQNDSSSWSWNVLLKTSVTN